MAKKQAQAAEANNSSNRGESNGDKGHDNFDIIMEEIEKLPGPKKSTATSILAQCVFHDDPSPSMGIYVLVDGDIPLGWFNCFGCGEKGPWNKLAEQAGLEKIKEWNTSATPYNIVNKAVDDALLGEPEGDFKVLLRKLKKSEAHPWPESLDWRGYPGKLVRKIGGHIVNEDDRITKSGARISGTVSVLFPIKMEGKVRGAVTAIYEKQYKGQVAYWTSQGSWVKNYGLFPYSYVKNLIGKKKLNFVVLVEGPRDSLRLINNGIPALAILGANNFSATKALFVESLDVEFVYVMTDNDTGGATMWKAIKKVLGNSGLHLKRIKLPTEEDKHGDLIKMDPDNMPKKILRQFVTFLEAENGFVFTKEKLV
jgi:5S rRNA maturation endonuclease (ribonuclease M5)